MSHWESGGKSDEWYTPKYIFDALDCEFDIDVAHPDGITTAVTAKEFICSDSLSKDWSGFVWMNPPFGGRNGLTPWLDKFFEHGSGIALTPDRTSAPWFRAAWGRADLVMFLPKVRFVKPDGTLGKSPSNGTALWASGNRASTILRKASMSGLGIIARPE